MPFPEHAPNPAHRQAEQGMWHWIDQMGLCPTREARANTERTMPALLMALYYPHADADILELLSQWAAWAFIVDDEFDDGAAGRDPATVLAAITSLANVMNGEKSANPLAEALADLWARLTARCSLPWRGIFRSDVTAWLNTYYVEAVDRIAMHVLSAADFVPHRRESVGIRTFLDECEPALGLDPPDAVRLLPALSAARRAACDHVGLINDIFSVEKDLEVGYWHNAVFIMRHDHDHPLQEAVRQVNELLTGIVHQLIDAQARLPAELDAAGVGEPARSQALALVRGYLDTVRGNYDFHFQVPRYRSGGRPCGYVANLFGRPPRAAR